MRRTCFAALIGFLLIANAHAQVYQWRDGGGRLVYGDQPPPGVEATVLRSHPASGTRGAPPARQAERPAPASTEDTPEISAAERSAIAERTRQQEEAREKACQEARNYLAALESGQRVARFNEKGEREFLDEAARLEQIERTRATLRQNCSN